MKVMKIASIITGVIFALFAILLLIQMWGTVMPWETFMKLAVTAAVIIVVTFGLALLYREYIEGRELTVTILGHKPLPVVEIKPKKGWYDYRNKYTKGNTSYHVPADLTEAEAKEIQNNALMIFRLFGCEVYARIDFRYDGEQFYFLEVNTLPGMTPLSLTPMAAKEAGISFIDLITIIIEKSLK